MLPRHHRLNLKTDFKWVTAGNKIENEIANIYYRFSTNQDKRVGIALTKKNFENTPEKNRAKRLVSFAVEKLFNDLKENLSLIIMPKKAIIDLSSGEVLENFKKILMKEQIINE